MEVGTEVTIIASDFNGKQGTVVPNEIGDGTVWVKIDGIDAPLPFVAKELREV